MESLSNFAEKYYIVFAIISLFLVFALIGYFIEKKNTQKKLNKEELKTINIQEQVNQMNDPNAGQPVEMLGEVPPQNDQTVQPIAPQDTQTQDSQTVQDIQPQTVPAEPVPQAQIDNAAAPQDAQPIAPAQVTETTNQNQDGNIEILG